MYYGDELYHFGVKGQKWGVRRYQNTDGSYKSGAEGRYDGDGSNSPKRTLKGNLHRLAASNYNLNARTYSKLGNKSLASMNKAAANRSLKKAQAADEAAAKKRSDKLAAKQQKRDEKAAAKDQKRLAAETKRAEKAAAKEQKAGSGLHLSDRQKKALKVGAAVGATVLAAYGAKKLYDHVDATNKGKLLAKKLLSDNNGDMMGAVKGLTKREGNLQREWSFGGVKKSDHNKLSSVYNATRKEFQNIHRQTTDPYKDLANINSMSKAHRKEQFDKATKGIREAASKVGDRAKSGADAARSRAGEAASRARSAYERNAGKRMANSINRSYARKQAMNKAKDTVKNASGRASSFAKSGASSARNTASRAANAAKSGASRAQEYMYNKSMERTREKYNKRVMRDLKRKGRL